LVLANYSCNQTAFYVVPQLQLQGFAMSDLVADSLDMTFPMPDGESVQALKDVSFTLKKGG